MQLSYHIQIYIYHNHTHGKDHFCKNPFIREEELIKQIDEIFDKIDIDELGTRHIIEREVARYNNTRANLLGEKENDKTPRGVVILGAYRESNPS